MNVFKIALNLVLIIYVEGNTRPLVPVEVKVVGEMKTVMKLGDGSAKVSVEELPQQHLYGLGPLENLAGEITIVDGRSFIAKLENEKVVIDQSVKVKAPFFVFSSVSNWTELKVQTSLSSFQDVEKFVEVQAQAKGLDLEKPFPFLLTGEFNLIKYHVVRGLISRKGSNPEVLKTSFVAKNLKGTVLGFYSKLHEGVFTHHGEFVHLHFISKDETQAGHVDALSIETHDGNLLKIPKQD